MQRSGCVLQIRTLQKSLQSRIVTSILPSHHTHIPSSPTLISIRQSSTAFSLSKAPNYLKTKKTLEETRQFLKDWVKNCDLEITDKTCEILALIESRDLEKAVSLTNQSSLTRDELRLVLKHMLIKKEYRSSITVYNKYKPIVSDDTELTSILLQCSYNLKNYNAFEELFAYYMQFKSSDLESHYLELGLKVHLRLNPEFAKQLLYQMVYMEYPIGKDLFSEFFRIARRYASFDVIKFGLDLLINNPKIRISEKTYGELLSSYLVDGTDYDLKKFFNFLLERSALNSLEIRMVSFVEGLRRHSIDEVWAKVEKFKRGIDDEETLERFYDKLYLQLKDRLDYPNLMIYLNMLEMDGVQNNNYKSHERICSTFGRLRDNEKFLQTLEIIRDSGVELNGSYIKLFWRTLCETNPDLTPSITKDFHILVKEKLDPKDINRTLQELNYYSSPDGFKLQRISKTNDLLYKRILPLLSKRDEKSDTRVFHIINESIREGKRPPIFLLLEILRGYIQRKSEHTLQFIMLIQNMFKTRSIDFDLLVLKKDLLGKQTKDSRIKRMNRFLYENKESLNYNHYNEIATLLINIGEFQRALEYLNYGRNSVKPVERSEVIKIYVFALKALMYKLDYKGFIALMNLIANDKLTIITDADLASIKGYSNYFIKKGKVQDLSEFDAAYKEIKSKHSAFLLNGREASKRTIKFLRQWLAYSKA
ncbi:hypothetical protein WICPIJ_005527 [Wickerhamomyces pijperi]|uniref:Uncharacterized protein n=1 Tax=Wickerhamomyces pijperi TaxID=599730 RepID=A0A9P8Q5K5_WICPI|nr:hypothetical protein WICPIJ_005527 [Wickerhamomyces pijperi]